MASTDTDTDTAVRDLIQQLKDEQETLKLQLQADRDAHAAIVKSLQETIGQLLASGQVLSTSFQPANVASVSALTQSSISSPVLDPTHRIRRGTGSLASPQDLQSIQPRSIFSGITGGTGDDDSDSGDDESFFVQEPLSPESFDEEALRLHLKGHPWDDHSTRILGAILDDRSFLDRENLFEDEAVSKGSHENYTHGSVYDVGADGSALLVRTGTNNRSRGIWQSLQTLNVDSSKRQAVGRIAIAREPSALLFGAIHYTMKSHFDMDAIFRLLSDSSPTKAYMKNCYERDTRQQRSFVFCLKYYTIVSEERKPMEWQSADADLESTRTHIPISACSSVVALSLSGNPIAKVRSRSRRSDIRTGHVYDPFAPWRILNIQCYPDWNSTLDDHESNRHYINGPDAFLVTLITEYRDAQKRFREINKRIVALATPPADFMFNRYIRDVLLFEDETYTYSRRYFWAFQTLATMNDKIEDMINAYKETFTEDVWTGKNKLLWPGEKDQSSRFNNWRTKMVRLRREFENEIKALEEVLTMNLREQKDIKSLRDQLFSGTSVLESRKSVEQTRITVQQGQNIKILTLVNLIFLPLTLVTSIFGMTNMPQNDNFVPFGIVVVVICLPTYLLIASLNTPKGYRWWQNRITDIYRRSLLICHWVILKIIRNEGRAQLIWEKFQEVDQRAMTSDPSRPQSEPRTRTQTTLMNMAAREDTYEKPSQLNHNPRQDLVSRPSIQIIDRPHPNRQRTSFTKFSGAAPTNPRSSNRTLTEPMPIPETSPGISELEITPTRSQPLHLSTSPEPISPLNTPSRALATTPRPLRSSTSSGGIPTTTMKRKAKFLPRSISDRWGGTSGRGWGTDEEHVV